jgi:hypothetical protein
VSTARSFARLPAQLQERLLARAKKAGHPVTDLQVAEAFRLVPALADPGAERPDKRAAASGERRDARTAASGERPDARAATSGERRDDRAAGRVAAAASPAPRRTSSPSSEPPAEAIEIALTAEYLRFLLGKLGAPTAGTLEELADRFSALLTSISSDSTPADSIPA